MERACPADGCRMVCPLELRARAGRRMLGWGVGILWLLPFPFPFPSPSPRALTARRPGGASRRRAQRESFLFERYRPQPDCGSSFATNTHADCLWHTVHVLGPTAPLRSRSFAASFCTACDKLSNIGASRRCEFLAELNLELITHCLPNRSLAQTARIPRKAGRHIASGHHMVRRGCSAFRPSAVSARTAPAWPSVEPRPLPFSRGRPVTPRAANRGVPGARYQNRAPGEAQKRHQCRRHKPFGWAVTRGDMVCMGDNPGRGMTELWLGAGGWLAG
ncbi:hypothetical protein C8Q79DRAFT_294234 [Trametes meyenii]|nr:hypothetical protein C8Q79DRAFT_294234 [Trametes meyenii]